MTFFNLSEKIVEVMEMLNLIQVIVNVVLSLILGFFATSEIKKRAL